MSIEGRSRVDVIVGGVWWSPDVVGGLRDLGCSTRLITARPAGVQGVETRVVRGMSLALRCVRGYRRADATVFRVFGELAARQLRKDSTVVAWSSFGLGAIRRDREVILVRGSNHIDRQREILGSLARRLDKPVPMPNSFQAALERREYGAAEYVSVPTSGIAADEYWHRDGAAMNVSPYGFPPAAPATEGGRVVGRVVFAGEVGYRKGVDVLAAALARRGDPARDVLVCGDPARGFSLDQLPDWWTLSGWVGAEQMREAMRTSGVLALLSREEGMARVGLEALACGTPIVVSRATGLAEWLVDGGGAVVDDAEDAREVRFAISQVMEDWTAHSARARELAALWSWTDHARSLLSERGTTVAEIVTGAVRELSV